MKADNSGNFKSCTARLLYMLGLLLGISCAGTTWYYKKQMYLQYQTVEQRFHSATNRYLAVAEEARLLREYYPSILELQAQGVVGPERRLDWIEALQHSGKHLALPALNYRIGIQQELNREYQFNSENFRVYYSPMQLDVILLHEEDLRELFKYLNGHGLGMYSISSCRLSRLRKDISQDPKQGNIRSECELAWFNIRKQDGGVIDLS